MGEPEPQMMEAVEMTEPFLPTEKPRYAMGLGTPPQIVELVARGVDMFDCVLPTRIARNGTAFTYDGAISIKAAYRKSEWIPIEEECDCFACRHFTRAYLRHLFKAEEILGLRMFIELIPDDIKLQHLEGMGSSVDQWQVVDDEPSVIDAEYEVKND